MSPSQTQNPTTTFDQIKSNFFRVVHADGAWFSVSPQGFVHITFFSERTPIAKQVTHEIVHGNQLGKEIPEKRVAREAYIREMEVDIVLSPQAVLALHGWLKEYVDKLVADATAAAARTPSQ